MLGKLLECLSRNRVLRRRLPADYGGRTIFVTPDSALQYLKPGWGAASKELWEVVGRFFKPGDSVWDVGANVGAFAFAAAHRVRSGGRVLVVEADPFLALLLQQSASLPRNADLHVHVLCAAVSDRAGIAKFLVASRGRSSNGLERSGQRSEAGGVRYAQYVPTVSPDALLDLFGRPDFLKVDIEGAKCLALQG